MAEPFNLNTARAEVEREPLPFVFGDPPLDFTIPHYLDWDGEATQLLTMGDLAGALQLIMGGQFDKFWALKPKNEDLQNLFDHVEREMGLAGLGESPPSRPPSASTGRPLSPTSSAATGSSSRPRASRKGPGSKRPGASGR